MLSCEVSGSLMAEPRMSYGFLRIKLGLWFRRLVLLAGNCILFVSIALCLRVAIVDWLGWWLDPILEAGVRSLGFCCPLI